MRVALALALVLGTTGLGCATPVEVARYRGVYSTHFDDVPDSAAICAVLENTGERPVDWVRLRLVSRSHLGERQARWTSLWVYRGRIAPGESVAVRLESPPVSEAIDLRVQRTGSDRPPRGRPAHALEQCADPVLEAWLDRRDAGRHAPGMTLHSMARPGAGPDDLWVAEHDPSAVPPAAPERAPLPR